MAYGVAGRWRGVLKEEAVLWLSTMHELGDASAEAHGSMKASLLRPA